MDLDEHSLRLHKDKKGKLEITSKVSLKNFDDLSLSYTPGVAEPCLAIHKNEDMVYTYTSKGNMVAVVTDGSAVLGLGNIGAKASLPVMEGKAILLKEFGGVDAFPIALDTQDTEEIIKTVKHIAPGFGGILLEDISAPRCFEIEERLRNELDIPVFHDDQHGTAIVVLAGLINALKLKGKELKATRIVVFGAGAAGIATTKLLLKAGASDIIVVDSIGAIYEGRKEGMNLFKEKIAQVTNREKITGDIHRVLKGKDVLIGLSKANLLTEIDIKAMNPDPIIFAMANPSPEIDPEIAKKAGAFIVATGRSDYPNQVNNILAFPGIFRGVLDCRACGINDAMKMATVRAITTCVDNPTRENIIPSVFDSRVVDRVARYVKEVKVSQKNS